MYTVNNHQHASFLDAIKHAKAIGADVIEAETGKRRWTPAAAKPAKTTAHVLINKDGTRTLLGHTR